MANLNNKYNNSFIYTIRSPHTDKFYIGSTTQKLCKRFANHKTDYNLYVNNKLKSCITSFKIIELGDSYIELLEEMNCDSKIQLEMREGELIRLHKDHCINKNMAGIRHQINIDIANKKLQKKQDKIQKDNEKLDLSPFLNKCCEIRRKSRIRKSELFETYINYCNEHNLAHVYRNTFYELLTNKNIFTKRIRGVDYYSINIINKTPKTNITKEDYDFLICCDKLMNLQYSYKKLIIV